MKNLTVFTITLSLLLSLTLWQQRPIVAAKAPPVPATFNVPAGDVNGLIAAINAANNETANPGPDTIVLAAGTYSFGVPNNWEFGPNALPIILSDITIEGNGAVLTSTAPTRLRFFYVAGSGVGGLNPGRLTLRDLTLQNGKQKGGDSGTGGAGAGMGGAIFNHGTLEMERVTFNDNKATGGSGSVGTSQPAGGIGSDATAFVPGGFGGTPIGMGGLGGEGTVTNGSFARAGGGGGFLPGANGGNGGTSPGPAVGAGGGLGLLGGKGGGEAGGIAGDGGGGWGSDAITNNGFSIGAGGNYGFGGDPINIFFTGSGGGVGGGGHGSGGGGFGGGGGAGGGRGGNGGFGGGGGNSGFGGDGGGGGGLGGAIFNHLGTVTLINCTLTGNAAQGGNGANGGSGLGGAIFNLNGMITVTNSTFAANTVTAGTGGTPGADGGALYNLAYGNKFDGTATTATVTLSNSILANSSGASKDLVNDQRDLTTTPDGSQGAGDNTAEIIMNNANLVESQMALSGATGIPAPTTAADPGLDALALNAPGLTPTMALTVSSTAALDQGICDPGVTTDQRGVLRPQGAGCDLGAYEFIPPNTPPAISGATISRQQGSPASSSQIATVNDNESGAGGVTVTVTSANPSNGVTVSNLVNTSGNVTADVVADCTATSASFTLTATDGNGATAIATLTVTVGANTAPTLGSYSNTTLSPGGSTTVTPTAAPADNGSINSLSVSAPGFTGTLSVSAAGVVSIGNAGPAGNYVVTVTVTDNCGMQTVRTFNLSVTTQFNFVGFFQPVDNLPTVNSVNAGQSIPVKFSLTGYQGMNIFAAGFPTSQSITCSSGIPDAIEETATAGASGLSYDAATDRYTYVWKTEKAWKNTCRKLVVKFTDGTTREALFQFR